MSHAVRTRRPPVTDRLPRSRRTAALLLALLFGHAPSAHAVDPVDPQASAEARALLTYLDELPNRLEARVISGQTIHGDLDAQYETYIKGYREATGVWPGFLQLMLYAHWLDERGHRITHRSDGSIFPYSYNHANRGGYVMWIYNPNNPFTGQGNKTPIPDGHALDEVYTAGTAANDIWKEDLQMLALQAKRLDEAGIPVIIRMFGEYNNDKVRWQNVRSNAGSSWEAFRAAWRFAVGELRTHDAHNVLWCLEEASAQKNYRLLGWQEDWIDIQGMQALHDNDTVGPLALYTDYLANSAKPILYGQFLLTAALRTSAPSYHYTNAIDLVRETMPRVTAIIPWSVHEWGLPEDLREHSPVDHLDAAAYSDDPWIANRGELDVTFGHRRRATLPTARDPITVAGSQAENFDTATATWRPGANGSIQHAGSSDGIHDVFFFGPDPILKRAGQTMPSSFDRLRIRLRSNSLADHIELSWKRTTDDDWSDQRRALIPVRQMGVYLEEYSLDLSDHPQWNGTIRSVRLHLNPDHHWGSAEIDYIKFDRRGGQPPTALVDTGFETSLGVGWAERNRSGRSPSVARYDRSVRSGRYARLVYLRDEPADGITQDLTPIVMQQGPGNYRFGAHLTLPKTVGAARRATGRVTLVIRAGGEKTVHTVLGELSKHEWSKLAGSADLSWTGDLEEARLIVNSIGTSEDLLIDDAIFKKLDN
jgi:hypothetical protein